MRCCARCALLAGCRVVQKDFTPSEEDPSLKTYVAHMLTYIM